MTLNEYYKYLEKLEVKYGIDQALRKRKPESDGHGDSNKKKQKTENKNKNKKKGEAKKGSNREEPCKHCNKWHAPADDECWTLKKNKDKRQIGRAHV